MLTRVLALAKRFAKSLYKQFKEFPIKLLYARKDYLQAYSSHTNMRVEENPHRAVGGMWEEIGKLQFEFLKQNGMKPYHSMLDIGCGTLRGGRHFIRYLEPGKYTGFDISSKAIEYGRQLVKEEGLVDKSPQLVVSKSMNLKFREFGGEQFDYLLAQSVFTGSSVLSRVFC